MVEFVKVLSIIFFIICLLGSGYYIWISIFKNKKEKTIKYYLFHLGFSLVLILLGIGFIFYYPYNQFGLLTIMFNVFAIYLGFILAYYIKSVKGEKIVLLTFSIYYIILTLWKLLFFKDVRFVQLLPLNVCNLLVIFIIIKPFKSFKVLDSYIVVFGLIAGIVNILMGQFYDNLASADSHELGFFYFRMLESTILHDFFFTYLVFVLLRRIVVLDFKHSLLNIIWITIYFSIFIFLNQIWRTDYFFTGKYPITPDFLVSMQDSFPLQFHFVIAGFEFEFIPLYYLFLLAAAFGLLIGLTYVLQKVQTKFIKPREDDYIYQ